MSFGRRKIPKHLIIEDYYQPKKGYGFGWIFLALTVLIGSMLLSIYVNAEEPLYESKSGQLLYHSDLGYFEPALHISSQADVEINGIIAHVTLSQNFFNDTNNWQEGIYTFPLPESAAIHHMEIEVGDKTIIGEIQEKQHAIQTYELAKKEGRHAAITQQKRPNIFTQNIANIAPQESVRITIKYIQNIEYIDGDFHWRFPMTITPRYTPKSQEENRVKKNLISSEASPPSDRLIHDTSHGDPISLSITLNSGYPLAKVNAPSHDVSISKDGKVHRIKFTQGRVNMDRDFILNWSPTKSHTPRVATFTEHIDDTYYSVAMVIPPNATTPDAFLERDVVFILDISGSMKGPSIQQAKTALTRALDRLQPEDRFNIIAFNNETKRMFPRLEYADKYSIQRAVTWIRSLEATKGTEMQLALETAFKQFSDGNTLQQVVFITDGAVSNEAHLFNTIHKELGNARLFTVGIGAAPNTYFMKKAAEFGRGTHTIIENNLTVLRDIDLLFSKIDSASIKNITVDWPGTHETFPTKIPDLYQNAPLVISTKSPSFDDEIYIRGESANQIWKQEVRFNNRENTKGIATLWARAKIEELEDLKISGANPEVIRQEVTTIALRHQLLSPYTSFVAVDYSIAHDKSDLTDKTHITAPTHQYKHIKFPKTSTTSEFTWWSGLFVLMILIIVRRMFED